MMNASSKPKLLAIGALGCMVLSLVFLISFFEKSEVVEDNQPKPKNSRSSVSRVSKDNSDALLSKAREFAKENPLAGIEFAKSLEDPEKSEFLDVLFASWALHDPNAAFDFITSTWKEGFDEYGELPYERYMYTVIETWSKKDPSSALAVLLGQAKLSDEEQLSYKIHLYMDTAIQQWSEKNPKLAFEWLVEQDKGHIFDRAKIVESIVEQWAKIDPLQALRAAEFFQDAQSEQQSVYNTALTVWSAKDAVAAADWFDQNLSGLADVGLSKAAEQIGQNLFSQLSGEEALEWVDTLSNEENRQSSLGSLVFSWAAESDDSEMLNTFQAKAQSEPETYLGYLGEASLQLAISKPDVIAKWINTQETLNASTDAVISSAVLVVSQTHQSYELAAEWSQQIQDDNERWFAQELLLDFWGAANREQLSAWLKKSGDTLPDHLRDKF